MDDVSPCDTTMPTVQWLLLSLNLVEFLSGVVCSSLLIDCCSVALSALYAVCRSICPSFVCIRHFVGASSVVLPASD